MDSLYDISGQKTNTKAYKKRDEVVRNVVEYEQASSFYSQRKWAESRNIPRSTLQYWLKRKERIDAEPELISFFESEVGLAFLHRLLTAVHFEFGQNGLASIRNICKFLQLSGLHPFVASSYGVHQQISQQMEESIGEFAQLEQAHLSKNMAEKKITLCEDETFHPEVCLVAIEPVSNYIVLEEYAADRSGASWNQALTESLSALPVEVIQCTSDEGKGLINHVKKGLGAHHSPDLFHIPYEISKGTSGALSKAVTQADKEYQKAVERSQKEQQRREHYESRPLRPLGARPKFEEKIACALSLQQQAEEKLKQAQENQEVVKNAKREIGQLYHPYAPLSGNKQDSEMVEMLLQTCFKKINEAIQSLSDRCKKHVAKAQRLVDEMKATIAFFFSVVSMYVEDAELPPTIQELMHQRLIPGFYLQQVAQKEKDSTRKTIISQKSKELLSVLYNRDGPFADWNEKQLYDIEKAAKECAQIFQRSSSCVEGRNAQLSLYHHGIHRLSNRKLCALTAIHNFYTKRADGTTAAERFFEAKPKNMFEWLLDRMDLPARPRRREPKAA